MSGGGLDRPVLVLHDVGDAGGGGPWREALADAGWTGTILAPDLPGHVGAPPPEGGQHESADAAFVAVRTLAAAGVERGTPVVVGVGVNGWSAQLHGLGGRASAVVLVDGLGGPWVTVREEVLAGRDRLRAIAADPEAVAPMPPGAPLDPRLRHGVPPHGSRRMAFEAAARMPVPVLTVESAASGTPPEDAEAIAAAMGLLVRLPDAGPTPAAVAQAIVDWCR